MSVDERLHVLHMLDRGEAVPSSEGCGAVWELRGGVAVEAETSHVSQMLFVQSITISLKGNATISIAYTSTDSDHENRGDVAHMVERSLRIFPVMHFTGKCKEAAGVASYGLNHATHSQTCLREVRGSIPRISTLSFCRAAQRLVLFVTLAVWPFVMCLTTWPQAPPARQATERTAVLHACKRRPLLATSQPAATVVAVAGAVATAHSLHGATA